MGGVTADTPGFLPSLTEVEPTDVEDLAVAPHGDQTVGTAQYLEQWNPCR